MAIIYFCSYYHCICNLFPSFCCLSNALIWAGTTFSILFCQTNILCSAKPAIVVIVAIPALTFRVGCPYRSHQFATWSAWHGGQSQKRWLPKRPLIGKPHFVELFSNVFRSCQAGISLKYAFPSVFSFKVNRFQFPHGLWWYLEDLILFFGHF